MSGQWDRYSHTEDEPATTFESNEGFGDRGHDRIYGDNPIPRVSSTIAMTDDIEDIEVDITAEQKMLSAVSGSLFTSLLGRLLHFE